MNISSAPILTVQRHQGDSPVASGNDGLPIIRIVGLVQNEIIVPGEAVDVLPVLSVRGILPQVVELQSLGVRNQGGQAEVAAQLDLAAVQIGNLDAYLQSDLLGSLDFFSGLHSFFNFALALGQVFPVLTVGALGIGLALLAEVLADAVFRVSIGFRIFRFLISRFRSFGFFGCAGCVRRLRGFLCRFGGFRGFGFPGGFCGFRGLGLRAIGFRLRDLGFHSRLCSLGLCGGFRSLGFHSGLCSLGLCGGFRSLGLRNRIRWLLRFGNRYRICSGFHSGCAGCALLCLHGLGGFRAAGCGLCEDAHGAQADQHANRQQHCNPSFHVYSPLLIIRNRFL